MNRLPIVLAVCVLLAASLACGGVAAPTVAPTATADVQATVDSAVAATATSQAAVNVTVEAAVQATAAAVPTPAATVEVETVEYVTLSEDELAAKIEEAVAEATASTQECSEATTAAASDGTITAEETEALEAQAAEANADLAYAEELISAYYDLYGDMAGEATAILQDVEQDLAAIADELSTLNDTLAEISDVLEQGLELADETIAQLEDTARSVAALVQEVQVQEQAQQWRAALQEEMESRAAAALAVVPTDVPYDRQAALSAAFDYVDGVRQALNDGRVSQEELQRVAQLGANAGAGLNAHGGPRLQQFSSSINDITAQIARGEVPQARTALDGLEAGLGSRPARP